MTIDEFREVEDFVESNKVQSESSGREIIFVRDLLSKIRGMVVLKGEPTLEEDD